MGDSSHVHVVAGHVGHESDATDSDTDAIDDLLDDALFLEDRFEREGYAEGLAKGHLMGFKDAYPLGLQHGADLGMEVGYYGGCVEAWKQVLAVSPTATPRVHKVLRKLETSLADFNLSNNMDADTVDALDGIRAKFRQLASLTSKGQQSMRRGAGTVPAEKMSF